MISATTPSRCPSARGRRAALILPVVALLLAGCAGAPPQVEPTRSIPAPVAPSPTATATPPPMAEPAPPAQPPVSVSIAAIGLDAPLIDLGIGPDGTMEVPTDYDDVGWFTGGSRPGAPGPTVIAAHVDSFEGPAAFFSLPLLVPGDVVSVTDAAGAVVHYEVYLAEDYTKAGFPTAQVFGATVADELRLITCTGFFDRDAGDYESNRVVYARAL